MNTNHLKIGVLTSCMLLVESIFASSPERVITPPQDTLMSWIFEHLILIAGATAILAVLWAIAHLNNQLMALNKIRVLEEHGIEVATQLELAPRKESIWKRLYKRMTQVVPIEEEQDVLLDHDYDGIKELDNILPPWWVGLFYVTIVLGVGYFTYYHVSDSGLSSAEAYHLEIEQADAAVNAYLAQQANQVDENNVEALIDANELALGQSIFINKCSVCHGQQGEGGVGPNLTDSYWLHGGGVKNIFKTIKYGVPEKGMISWKSQLRASDMQRVSSFILTLEGSTPDNAKAPEGDIYEASTEEPKSLGLK